MNKKMKIFLLMLIIVLAIIGIMCFNKDYVTENENVQIQIAVFDKMNSEIYSEDIITNAEYLSDALREAEGLEMVTEDGDYGEYITSIMGIEQGDNYYWSYYVNEEYATTGISGCKIEDGATYSFKIEKFEY